MTVVRKTCPLVRHPVSYRELASQWGIVPVAEAHIKRLAGGFGK